MTSTKIKVVVSIIPMNAIPSSKTYKLNKPNSTTSSNNYERSLKLLNLANIDSTANSTTSCANKAKATSTNSFNPAQTCSRKDSSSKPRIYNQESKKLSTNFSAT